MLRWGRAVTGTTRIHKIVERPLNVEVSCEISEDLPRQISSRGPTAVALPGRGCGSLAAPTAAMKNPHLPMTEL